MSSVPVMTKSGIQWLWPDGSTHSLAPPSSSSLKDVLSRNGGLLPSGRPLSFRSIYESQPMIAAAINLKCRVAASLPLKTYVRRAGGEVERDRDSPWARLLKWPAPRVVQPQMIWRIQLGLEMDANHVEELVDGPNGPELRPIDWRQLVPILSEDRRRVIQWKVRNPTTGAWRTLRPDQVLHFGWPGIDTPIGISQLVHLEVTAKLEDSAQTFAQAMLDNGARVGAVVTLADEFAENDAVLKSVKEQIEDQHAGPDKANQIFAFAGIKDVKTLDGQTAVEAELVKQREVGRIEVAGVTGVSLPLIGDPAKATLANVEEYSRQLVMFTMAAPLAMVGDIFTSHLLREHPLMGPAEGIDAGWAEYDLNALLAGDPKTRAETYDLMRKVGALTIDDIRDREGLARFNEPWSKVPLIDITNMAMASALLTGSTENLDPNKVDDQQAA